MGWAVGVDVGGTFTDLVAWDVDGGDVLRAKVLTVPADPVRGVVAALREAAVNLQDSDRFVHGSTIAINAVLQGTGARTALLTTLGFRDVLEMGRKNRPDMYNLFFEPRLCPVPRTLRLEVGERLLWTGEVLRPLDRENVTAALASLPDDVEAIAICFLHSYANPAHESEAAIAARAARPNAYVTASTELSRESREYERTATAVVNAYVGPLVSTYVGKLELELKEAGCAAPLLITQSNGGVMPASVAIAQPVRTMESGPAAGVTATAALGRALSESDLIAFDMGGTSAKACVIEDGEPESAAEYYVGGRLRGLPVQIPFLEIVEVGAGGGSIAHLDQAGGLRVGPRSAGADPGPAAYDRGGREPTITDANVVAGRIAPDYFLGGSMPLSVDRARTALRELGDSAGLAVDDCAAGILRIANAVMAGAIREVTVEQGRDPRDFTLVAYGGAGPLHAAELAAELEIPRVLVPAGAGTFAAAGMLLTDLRHDVSRTFVRNVAAIAPEELAANFQELERDASAYLGSELSRGSAREIRHLHRVDVRYAGQFHTLTVTLPTGDDRPGTVAGLFHSAHLSRYGHHAVEEPVEVLALRVTAISPVVKPSVQTPTVRAATARRTRPVLFDDWIESLVLRRDELQPGARFAGPAIVEDAATNVLLRPQDSAELIAGGHVLITIGAAA
jgi:N-methylhydantoinase A